jgi:hypothetical protein
LASGSVVGLALLFPIAAAIEETGAVRTMGKTAEKPGKTWENLRYNGDIDGNCHGIVQSEVGWEFSSMSTRQNNYDDRILFYVFQCYSSKTMYITIWFQGSQPA